MADKRYFSRHTGTKIDTAVSLVDQKQDLLISGYNIKKINNLDLHIRRRIARRGNRGYRIKSRSIEYRHAKRP